MTHRKQEATSSADAAQNCAELKPQIDAAKAAVKAAKQEEAQFIAE